MSFFVVVLHASWMIGKQMAVVSKTVSECTLMETAQTNQKKKKKEYPNL